MRESKVKFTDASTYQGHLTRHGMRTGFGILCGPPFITREEIDKADASEHINHWMDCWMEYAGEWQDDQPNGYGIVRRVYQDGSYCVESQGTWCDGLPDENPANRFGNH
jgi:hypothetical protein